MPQTPPEAMTPSRHRLTFALAFVCAGLAALALALDRDLAALALVIAAIASLVTGSKWGSAKRDEAQHATPEAIGITTDGDVNLDSPASGEMQ